MKGKETAQTNGDRTVAPGSAGYCYLSQMEKFASATASASHNSVMNNNEDDNENWDADGENHHHHQFSSSLTSSSSSSLIGENAAVDLAVKQERELEKSHLKVNNNQCSSSNGEMRNGVVGVNHANLNAVGGKDLKSLAKVVTQLTAIRSKEMETKGYLK